MNKTLFFQLISIVILVCISLPAGAQRKVEKLDRGVVAVRNTSNAYFVSWRYLATDPEDVRFNLYAKKSGASDFTLLNQTPLRVTNFQTTTATVGSGTELYVKPVIDNIEGEASGSFRINASGFNTYRSAFLDISFNPAKDGLELADYSTKFCWPADLDGDGEYDYVVDRLSTNGNNTHKVQGYLRDGTLLWTIDMGPNVNISQGHNDMVIAYDMDCDGKAEVVIKSSDGTRFWDKENNSWGKYLLDSANGDTDGDGIVNYTTQSTKNPPQYITVLDGMTGAEINTIEMPYPKDSDGHQYTRNNKSNYMSGDYSNLNGHMAIAYLDGVHPSVVMEYMCRRASDQFHYYYVTAWGYKFEKGIATDWEQKYTWNRGRGPYAEFHHIRVADVDFDGHDEMLDGGFGIKYDGTPAFNAFISHGDRFRVSDIDPERPGLETFAIQQNAADMLGMILYDSGTGEAIKKWYLSANGDVGRGECMDIDPNHLGYEIFSTMPNIYNAKGEVIHEGSTPFPREGVWWDGDLLREELAASDGNGYNADIRKYVVTSHDFSTRLIEFAKMTNWQVNSEYGTRPAFFGDIIGDWREEVILKKLSNGVCTGFVGFSTDYATENRIYCLMQNPAYRMQATTKGYYQSAFPDYYLGHSMPEPPIPPVHSAKLRWMGGNRFDKTSPNFVSFDQTTVSAFTDGDDVMFDISGDNSEEIVLTGDVAPSKLWAMNPLGKDYTLTGSGKLTGDMELVKSMYGVFTLNGNHTYSGKTTISEGTLAVNGSLESFVDLRAKGTLSGNAILNGGIKLNEGLNEEGGRLSPGNGLGNGKLGKITINGDVAIAGKVNIEFDIIPEDIKVNDSLFINGNLTLAGTNKIIIRSLSEDLEAGTYSLIHWTGDLTGTVDNFVLGGISGLPMSLLIEDKTLKLIVSDVRSAGSIFWRGNENSDWDFSTENFSLNHDATYFVKGDDVTFDDNAVSTTVNLTDKLTTGKTTFNNESKAYILKGSGGISGSGDFVKTGKGLLDIQSANNNYTGKTLFTNALVQVASLNESSTEGILGLANVSPANFVMTDTRLLITATSTNTDRGITLAGSDTIHISKSNGVATISGVITGSGQLVKTGPGQLNLAGNSANTYGGGTIISGGTVGLGSLVMNKSAFGNGGKITLQSGGKINMYYNTSSYDQTPTWHVTVPEGHTGYLVTSGRCAIYGSISGGGTLDFYVPYVRTDLIAGGAQFTGKINVTTDSDGGHFRVTNNTTGFPLANIHLNSNVYMAAYTSVSGSASNANQQVKIGSLSGASGSTVGDGKWLIGSDNRDATFNGTFLPGATVTKSGSGSWTLTGASTCTATFTVNGGRLIARNNSGSATGTGAVNINSGGTLMGTGTINGATSINSGATLRAGISEIATGTLNFGSNLSLKTGALTVIKTASFVNDRYSVAGNLILKGTLEMQNLGNPYLDGKSFTIFNVTGNITGAFDAIEPAIPAEGLVWDLSRINEGIISVTTPTAIDELDGTTVQVYPTIVDDICYVSLGSVGDNVRIELVNQSGVVLQSRYAKSAELKHELNMSTCEAGFYFIRISEGEKSATWKVIKK